MRGTGEHGEVSGSRGSRSERLLAARSLAPPRLLLTPAEVATATPVLWGLWRQQGNKARRGRGSPGGHPSGEPHCPLLELPARGHHPPLTLRPPALGLCPSLLPVAGSAVTGTRHVHAPVQPCFDTATPPPRCPPQGPVHPVLRPPLSRLLLSPPGVSSFSRSLSSDGPPGICPGLTCSLGCFECTGRLQLPPSDSDSHSSIPRPHPHPRPELGHSPGRYKHHRLKIGIVKVPKPSTHISSLRR